MIIINAIEDLLIKISENKDLVVGGAVVALVGGLVLGLIMAPFFA